MLHILNGDASADMLRQTNLPGELLPWREALIDGPAPQSASVEEWISIRTKHLANSYDQEEENCRSSLEKLFAALEASSQHDEVVMWFDPDLFCQANLIFLLDWFSRINPGNTNLSLVCIDQFPGIDQYSGFGDLSPEQLASLFPQRKPLTDSHLTIGRQAWKAYSSPNPKKIELMLLSDVSELPYLHQALRLHLLRFPSVRNGLGRIENELLGMIKDGAKDFVSLFRKFCTEHFLYGLGDWQFWNVLSRLANAENPLLRVSGVKGLENVLTSSEFLKATFEISNMGETVMSGETDFIELNGIDLWLGGVHLMQDNLWRWDEEQGRLVGP